MPNEKVSFSGTLLRIYPVLATLLILFLAYANNQLMARLKTQAKVPVLIEQESAPSTGSDSAPVTIIEYTSLSCVYCRIGFQNLDNLIREKPNGIRVVTKFVSEEPGQPLETYLWNTQFEGTFWSSRSKVHALSHSPSELATFIAQLDPEMRPLDPIAWKRYRSHVDREVEELEIKRFPTYFVDGIRVEGSDLDPMLVAIEKVTATD
ncbi:Thioredoxin domain-containing protein [Sulfidibacter corallicola]|uniref:Thioredoxin domain-containing protein n=1 Tax=Sulfidibacter corallicola TaxID=2818388 RepID=A0A8A4TLB9_SULCO|nr:thioredoxin domain-containing protein [Sulfidibacter corallicola]QTD49658.1 thioredoxin domain-containing protein [Sulfidibacter corallicola]